jgi:hypothetical protein
MGRERAERLLAFFRPAVMRAWGKQKRDRGQVNAEKPGAGTKPLLAERNQPLRLVVSEAGIPYRTAHR